MDYATTLNIDQQGRIIIPAKVRKNISTANGEPHREMEQARYLQIYICIMYWITGLM